jgi:hypothetical protein
VTCKFVAGEWSICALGGAVLWPGVPVSAGGEDVFGRDSRADRVFLPARLAGYRAHRVAHDDAGLSVSQARVLVEYRVRIEQPKSRNSKRTLPLDGELVTALATLRKAPAG